MERYSSAVESKSRKDYLEMTRYWFEGGPEPEVFREAQNWIGAPGFRINGSASYASAVYSGVFCLLALGKARDWRRGESIQLQELHDHHIFPQAYLHRHGLSKRAEVNTIANRTLISDDTNGRIRDKAPADYVVDSDIFPSGARHDLLEPHFIDPAGLSLMREAVEQLSNNRAIALYERFVQARGAAIIGEIRRACGIAETSDAEPADLEPDEVAADLQMDSTSPDEEFELELDRATV
jgi:hypothetical protein